MITVNNQYPIKQLNTLKKEKKFQKALSDTLPVFDLWLNKDKYNIYATYNKKKIVGGMIINLEPGIYKTYKPDVALTYFIIKPAYRQRGLGRELIQLAQSKYNSIITSTNPKQTSLNAIRMYKRMNFKIIKEFKDGSKYWYWKSI